MSEVIAGRFRITGVLGEGAMGVVYQAHDEMLAREIALKEMRVPAGVDADEALERFVTEARAAARLSSPSIVTVHDVIVEGPRVLIAMELLQGATLAQALSLAPAGIEPSQVRHIMTSVAEALATAHTQGVVHRDLKPDNIFWLESGRVVVTDFGLARIGAGRGTQVGTVMGTPGYMAPEQIRGQVVGPPADVFSWGAVAYELLVGSSPFGGPELEATTLMWNVVNEPVPPLHIPTDPRLGEVIAWALEKDPDQRPQDATVLLQALAADASPVDLRSTHSSEPEAPQPAGPSDHGPSPNRRRSPVLLAGVVAAVVLVLATAGVLIAVLTGGDDIDAIADVVQPRTARGISPSSPRPVTAAPSGASASTPDPDVSQTPSAASTPTEDPASILPPGFSALEARLFQVVHPSSWTVKRAEEPVAGGSNRLEDTTITGDAQDLAIIRVNTTLDQPSNDPRVVIQPVLGELRTRETYVELGVTDELLTTASGTYDAVRWEYLLKHPTHDVMLHNVNYFIDAGTFSMALLTRAPVDQFESLRADFDLIRARLVIK